jgi:DNA replication protein DnaC
VKYNYKRIIGRNIELKECIKMMQRYNNVCICGHPGVGKSHLQNWQGNSLLKDMSIKNFILLQYII